MRVTGPAAQFGRGVMQDVSAKLMKRFADCIAEQLSGGTAESEAETVEAKPTDTPKTEDAGVPSASSGVSSAEAETKVPDASSGQPTAATPPPRQADDVLDLGEASRDAILKRAIPVVGALVALLVLIRLIRR
jgi:hypothetical protein